MVDARAALLQKRATPLSVVGRFDQLDVSFFGRQEGHHGLLPGYILDMADLKFKSIPPECERLIDIVHDDGNMIDAC